MFFLRFVYIFGAFFAILLACIILAYKNMIGIQPNPERPLPNANTRQIIEELNTVLKEHVTILANDIGERNIFVPERLNRAADYIIQFWENLGHTVIIQTYKIDGVKTHNLSIDIQGKSTPEELIIVGAHYDTVQGSPGANDNGSGVAALLEISRMLSGHNHGRTIRFVAFTNEEPPFFKTDYMGSLVFAKECHKRGENIVGMISLETIGFYNREKGSQKYPFPLSLFYPNRADFIAFIGNPGSKQFLQSFTENFMMESDFPVECAAVPGLIPGVDWSDHGSFWRYGYSAIMITDTALYRYPYYHLATDTFDKIDYFSLARVTYGIYRALLGF